LFVIVPVSTGISCNVIDWIYKRSNGYRLWDGCHWNTISIER